MISSALEGIRVIDLSRVLAGPYCTMMLADMGAEVIKIEMPGSGDDTRAWGPPYAGGESAYYLCVNRNKKSITLNLKRPEGRQIVLDLAKTGDVLLENFKVGTMAEMGLSYEKLQEINPRLVYCSLTGYGPDGPYANRPGYDFITQAEAGIMSFTGEPEGQPMKVGVAIVDMTAGMLACSAILAALRYRDQTGLGQRIDISLLEAAIAWLGNVGSNYLIGGLLPKRYGNAHPNIVPYETFRARDRYIAVGVGNDRQFRRFCEIIGKPEWADDPRFDTNSHRVENRDIIIPLIQEAFLARDADEWIAALQDAGIPCGPINTLDRVFDDPQVKARGIVVDVAHPTAGRIKLVGPPYKFSRTPATVRSHPPLLGEHTEQVLTTLLGYSQAKVKSLRQKGVI